MTTTKRVEYTCGHTYIKTQYGVIDPRCPRCDAPLYEEQP